MSVTDADLELLEQIDRQGYLDDPEHPVEQSEIPQPLIETLRYIRENTAMFAETYNNASVQLFWDSHLGIQLKIFVHGMFLNDSVTEWIQHEADDVQFRKVGADVNPNTGNMSGCVFVETRPFSAE